MWPFLILFSALTMAENQIDIRTLRDETFTRDNTFCTIAKERIQIQLRGVVSHTEPGEGKYGDWILYYPGDKPKLLPINADRLNKYRLFEGHSKGSICSKSYGFAVGKDKVAVLFLEENRPFLDKLTVQLFDNKTNQPLNVLETNYLSNEAEGIQAGFAFKTYVEKAATGNGTFKRDGLTFAYSDVDFPYWVKFEEKGMEISPELSFEKFPWKAHFKDLNQFLEITGWDAKNKKFNNTFLHHAMNHKAKQECILIRNQIIKINGEEKDWICR